MASETLERLAEFERWASYDLPLDNQYPMTRKFARSIVAEVARLRAENERLREESNRYRIEADEAMRDYDTLNDAVGVAIGHLGTPNRRPDVREALAVLRSVFPNLAAPEGATDGR